MNHILYNISIIMLLLGIILLTYYLTKANIPICSKDINSTTPNITQVDNAYKMKPSEIFYVMFNNPSLWQGYETVEVKHN